MNEVPVEEITFEVGREFYRELAPTEDDARFEAWPDPWLELATHSVRTLPVWIEVLRRIGFVVVRRGDDTA